MSCGNASGWGRSGEVKELPETNTKQNSISGTRACARARARARTRARTHLTVGGSSALAHSNASGLMSETATSSAFGSKYAIYGLSVISVPGSQLAVSHGC